MSIAAPATSAQAAAQPAPCSRWGWPLTLLLLVVLCTGLGLAVGAYWALTRLPPTTQVVQSQAGTPEVPLVMRTPGGMLEVATIRATERFSRRDRKAWLGIDLGETVTEVQLQATYRFHIPLARRWPVQIEDGVAEVDAPALRPSLPVAFDTSTLQTWSRNGWARFNKTESLQALQQSITPQLGERAQSPHYRDLATEAARRTVAEYVRTWLGTSGRPVREVRVRFPGETQAAAPSPPFQPPSAQP